MKKTLVALAMAGAVGALAGPALANTHVIDSNSTKQIEFSACRPFKVVAVGDGDTDLDFRLIDQAGRTVFADISEYDMTKRVVQANSCGKYTLYVQNVGDVWNEMELELVYVD